MEGFLSQIQTALVVYLPNILLALLVLVVGWIVALALQALTRSLLNRTKIDDRIAASLGGDPKARPDQIRVEHWIAAAVFWLVILVTLVMFFNVLNVPAISGPLGGFVDSVVAFIPALLGALVLLGIAWLVATVLKAIVVRVFSASGITRRLSETAEVRPQDRVSISQTIGNVVYWLVFLFFLPAILDVLNINGLLLPVQSMINDLLAFLPNLFAAALILLVGWLVARIVRQVVTNLLASLGIDRWGARDEVAGALGSVRLSNAIGTIVYVLILIPVAIAALNALNIPAVSQPAAEMLTNLLTALPAIFGAFLLLAIAYFAARFVGTFVAGVLANLGFNNLFEWLGVFRPGAERLTPAAARDPGAAAAAGRAPGAADSPLRRTPAEWAGYLVMAGILLFAAMEAANLLGFEALAALVFQFIVVAGRVLVGLVIFAFGMYLANLAAQMIRDSNLAQRNILAPVGRWAILFFAGALALREMGIAESIVNLAFGLFMGALAVAFALAFGLGGREQAARQLERWRKDLDGGAQLPKPPSPPTSPRSAISGADVDPNM